MTFLNRLFGRPTAVTSLDVRELGLRRNETITSRDSMQAHLARLGSVAAVGGALTLLAGSLLHPTSADPNSPVDAFTEYAADRIWVASHLLQFVGVASLGAALVALTGVMDAGRAKAWAWIGAFGAASAVATGAALQAVDGVALKVMVDRWAAASGDAKGLAFEGAMAVRQIEIGMASLFSVIFAFTTLMFSVSIFFSRRFPNWLGTLGVIGSAGTLAGGIAQAYMGFSALPMAVSMAGSSVLVLWALAIGVLMWRLARQLEQEQADAV